MMFGPWGNDDRADAVRVIHRALDAGLNFVDTADVYSDGISEEITGEALQGAATMSCWRPSSSCRWTTAPTLGQPDRRGAVGLS
jgi:predicted aldo/keto reductase-like oxidoreductase